MLENYINYGPYGDFVKTGKVLIDVDSINMNTWDDHFNGILNILRDGIETDFIHNTFVQLKFNNTVIELSITDYFFNLILWYLIIRVENKIEGKHLFFDENLTRNSIKKFIDDFFIDINRKKFSNKILNNIIDDALSKFTYIDEFSFYLANTINLEDSIDLMNNNEEFYKILHADLSNVPIEDVKTVGMDLTNQAIDIMKNSKHLLGYDHCLADSWRAQEGINPKQYKEFSINIGSKPNGFGGVFPLIINSSFINGGVNDIASYFIESSIGRTAQIMSKTNVGSSGHFARLLGINNTDTRLHHDPDYICDTKNYQELFVKDKDVFKHICNKYYRMNPDGMERVIKSTDTHIIGKTIYMRSPMTCASNSRSEGICYRCYGDLAYTVKDINIGKIAAEELSAKLTQILLSAKHLLETKIKKLKWNNKEKFFDLFEIDGNMIKLLPDMTFKGYSILIDPDAILLENEDDYNKSDFDDDSASTEVYNEYVTEFILEVPSGEQITISTKDFDKLYISIDLNEIIRKKGEPSDGKISIPLSLPELIDTPLFFIIIFNNELSKTMDRLMDILNKKTITGSMNRHELLQNFIETINEGGLNINGVHCEIIISNQIRNIDNILERPDWSYPNEPYNLLTLNDALTNNPSVVISMMYQRLSKVLYNPLTFKKYKPSYMDLFFMEKPQNYLNSTDIRPAVKDTLKDENLINPIQFVDKKESDED